MKFEGLTLIQLEVLEMLQDIDDPEIGINIVDLGLVRAVEVNDDSINIKATLTSAACPLSEMMEEQIIEALLSGTTATSINVIWEMIPPWDPQQMTADGKEQLKALGF